MATVLVAFRRWLISADALRHGCLDRVAPGTAGDGTETANHPYGEHGDAGDQRGARLLGEGQHDLRFARF
jgi:hypothetical protein